MKIAAQPGAALTLDQFWRWLQGHHDCILRAGAGDCFLYDNEDLHWHLKDDEDHSPVIEVLRGKQLIGEMVISPQDVLFVQATPDPETSLPDRTLFELIGGPESDAYPLYHFLLTHAFDDGEAHDETMKH